MRGGWDEYIEDQDNIGKYSIDTRTQNEQVSR